MNRQSNLREIKRVPVTDHMWLMAQLKDTLEGDAPLLPLGKDGTPELFGTVPEATALIIHTSGSSGVPKFVALSAEAVIASAKATNEFLADGDERPGQWMVALPTNLIAGVQMLTRSLVAGTTPVVFDGSFKPQNFIKRAEKLDGDRRYTSLVPVQLSRLLDYIDENPEAKATMQRFDKILVGGQATPLDLRQRAYESGLSLVRTYGMTETSGGLVYDGVEIGDAQMRIRDGEVQVAGSMLALGYITNGDESGEALTREKFIEDDGQTWFRTGDAGNLLGGMLSITGRIDRVIVSGGSNVSLDEVERVALAVPEFKQSGYSSLAAVSSTDKEWGSRVLLAVEKGQSNLATNDLSPELKAVISSAIKSELGAAAVPREFIVIEELPRLQNSKPDLTSIRSAVIAASATKSV